MILSHLSFCMFWVNKCSYWKKIMCMIRFCYFASLTLVCSNDDECLNRFLPVDLNTLVFFLVWSLSFSYCYSTALLFSPFLTSYAYKVSFCVFFLMFIFLIIFFSFLQLVHRQLGIQLMVLCSPPTKRSVPSSEQFLSNG